MPSNTCTYLLLPWVVSAMTVAAMSFGFSVGDIIAAADLAWKLYRHCCVVAKGLEVKAQEICTLVSFIKPPKDEVDDPQSTLRAVRKRSDLSGKRHDISGQDSLRRVGKMCQNI